MDTLGDLIAKACSYPESGRHLYMTGLAVGTHPDFAERQLLVGRASLILRFDMRA